MDAGFAFMLHDPSERVLVSWCWLRLHVSPSKGLCMLAMPLHHLKLTSNRHVKRELVLAKVHTSP